MDATTERVSPALLANHQRFLAFLERRVGSRARAEDILQAAFVRSLESGRVPDDEESAVAWMYRTLRNALVDQYRREGTEARALEREARGADEAAPDAELHATVCGCMKDLLPEMKPEYAELLQRVDLEERPLPEVARELGITANNAGVRLHRARAALRRELQRSCGSCATHGCLDCGCARKRAAAQGAAER
ncbi:sigma-70 family RNA polymerase sigma factor [Aggregicoccus sp. 17bor-14]|uniref:RNA polymerase sigma factor n=1 Tax=Myxococcaceae TaxID=31 RepID=UPI00129CCE6D|nr:MULTISPECIES: RNA polymerase sigma factor [Myxococcaceae]MBF5046479.1 sigma-70 family RNA polymerase sigma factor [Simulacricoccus sp. 17bor-14]MRI92196.1 sigma-70 family RNA polymerase sigma factor [Aggregicoccus sp. 17bor-14]